MLARRQPSGNIALTLSQNRPDLSEHRGDPMQSTTAAPITIITTMVVGGILALLGSFGIYSAAQPSALTGQQAEYNYGVK
jgi:hypothetical protein